MPGRAAAAPLERRTRRARAVIAAVAEAAPRRGCAVVLGSGLLDDVPLDRLAAPVARVSLMDAGHPWPARLAARAHAHVSSVIAEISAGLTGGLVEICADADLIVSANLLSQIPIVPLDAYEAGAGTRPRPRRAADRDTSCRRRHRFTDSRPGLPDRRHSAARGGSGRSQPRPDVRGRSATAGRGVGLGARALPRNWSATSADPSDPRLSGPARGPGVTSGHEKSRPDCSGRPFQIVN